MPTETPPTDATTDTLEAIAKDCEACAVIADNEREPRYANELSRFARRIRDVAARLTPEPVKPMTNRELLASLPVGSVILHQGHELTVTLDSIGKKYAHASGTILSLSEICGCDRCGAASNDPKVGIIVLSRPDASLPEPVPPPVNQHEKLRKAVKIVVSIFKSAGLTCETPGLDGTCLERANPNGGLGPCSICYVLSALDVASPPVAEVREEKPPTLDEMLKRSGHDHVQYLPPTPVAGARELTEAERDSVGLLRDYSDIPKCSHGRVAAPHVKRLLALVDELLAARKS